MLYGYVFRASSGDIYTGLLLEDAETYAPGDVISRPRGSYTIQSETASDRAGMPQGTIWTTAYFDAGANVWLATYFWGHLGGVPSGRGGFGSEYDYAWDGDEWDDFGVSGVHQADVERAAQEPAETLLA